MSRTVSLSCLALLFPVVSLAADSVDIRDPRMVDGKPSCDQGYLLLTDVCVPASAFSQYTPEEIAAAIAAKKDPAVAKQLQDNLAYKRQHGIPLYKTVIASDKSDILKLENGGIVEITSGYVGYIGYRKKCLLFQEGHQWKIWIEGKKVFAVELLKAPSAAPRHVISISEVLDLMD